MERAEIEAAVIAILAKQLLLPPGEIAPDARIDFRNVVGAAGLDEHGEAFLAKGLHERQRVGQRGTVGQPPALRDAGLHGHGAHLGHHARHAAHLRQRSL